MGGTLSQRTFNVPPVLGAPAAGVVAVDEAVGVAEAVVEGFAVVVAGGVVPAGVVVVAGVVAVVVVAAGLLAVGLGVVVVLVLQADRIKDIINRITNGTKNFFNSLLLWIFSIFGTNLFHLSSGRMTAL